MNYLYIWTIIDHSLKIYNLRPAPFPVPQVTHVYAEDRLVYKLVEMKN